MPLLLHLRCRALEHRTIDIAKRDESRTVELEVIRDVIEAASSGHVAADDSDANVAVRPFGLRPEAGRERDCGRGGQGGFDEGSAGCFHVDLGNGGGWKGED